MSELEWLDQAKKTLEYHRSKQLSSDGKKWTITMTANTLHRSLGSVCEDLLIAKWSKTHNLRQFEFAYEALNFIRMKKKEMELEE